MLLRSVWYKLGSLLIILPLTGCGYVRLKRANFQTDFTINRIPTQGDVYHDNYDLTFSLNFATSSKDSYGTGWLIDWKGDENKPSNTDPFLIYLATNLHVVDALRNPQDYEPYNKDSNGQDYGNRDITHFFALGKYTDPGLLGVETKEQSAFISIQTSAIPKTAYTANDFVDYQYDSLTKQWNKKSDQKDQTQEQTVIGQSWSYKPAYADFAVIEVPLFLDNVRDKQVFDYFVKPAIETYKKLGDTAQLFTEQNLKELEKETYIMLGYPVVESNIYAHILGQGKELRVTQQVNNQPVQKNYVLQTITKEQHTLDITREIPTLIQNKSLSGDFVGSKLLSQEEQQQEHAFLGNLNQGIIDFARLSNFNLQYHNREYQQYGKGLALANTNFSGGSSGTLVLNQQKQISGVYFGVLEFGGTNGTNRESSIGVGQILRVKDDAQLQQHSHNNLLSQLGSSHNSITYDIIFGNKDTKNYYAQFAKKHQTHLYSQISSSNQQELKYVDNDPNLKIKEEAAKSTVQNLTVYS